MIITPHSRISELIQADSRSIDALASLARPLQQLKNPFMRRLMASRVKLSDLVLIANCSIQDIRAVLEPLGFVLKLEEGDNKDTYKNQSHKPVWLQNVDSTNVVEFDVRAQIKSGEDPLSDILQKFSALPPQKALCIINSFVPTPLINLLARESALSYVEYKSANLYHTWFAKQPNPISSEKTTAAGQLCIEELNSFEKRLQQYDPRHVVALDVRTLPMPQPMQVIIEALNKLNPADILYIRHKRVPLHLLEEIENRPFIIHLCEVAEDDVRIQISIRHNPY